MNRTSTSSVNSQDPSAPDRRRIRSSNSSTRSSRRQFTAVVVLLLALRSAGAAPTGTGPVGGTVPPEVVSFLERHGETWLKPCRGQAQTNPLLRTNRSTTTTGNKDAETQMLQHLKAGLDLSLSSLEHWRNRSKSSERDTTWSTEEHKEKFKFLRPFVANVSTWERRLSIYWASLALVITVHEQQSGTIDSHPEVLSAMRELSEHNRQLLCHVQEYRAVVNEPSKPILPGRMSHTLKFDIRDVNEIKIDRWYIMCRLECYLKNMRAHVRQLIRNGAARPNTYRCKVCPYSRAKAAKKLPKPARGRGRGPGIVRPAQQQPQQHRPAKQPKQQQQQSRRQRKEKNATRKQQQQQQSRSKKFPNGSWKRIAGETSSSSSSSSSSPRPNRQG